MAITDSDTTSYISRHGKKSCCRVFHEQYHQLEDLGQGELDDATAQNAELFICKVDNAPNMQTMNKAMLHHVC